MRKKAVASGDVKLLIASTHALCHALAERYGVELGASGAPFTKQCIACGTAWPAATHPRNGSFICPPCSKQVRYCTPCAKVLPITDFSPSETRRCRACCAARIASVERAKKTR